MVNWKKTMFSSAGADDSYWGIVVQDNTNTLNLGDQVQVVTDSSGNCYFTEGFYPGTAYNSLVISADTDGSPVWARRIASSSSTTSSPYLYQMAMSGSNELALLGPIQYNLVGTSQDQFMVELNTSNGTTNWQKNIGKASNTYGVENSSWSLMQANSSNEFIYCGRNGNYNIFTEMSNTGTLNSSNMVSHSRSLNIRGLAIDDSDNLYVTGYHNYSSPSRRGFLTKHNSTGSSVTWNTEMEFSSSSYYVEELDVCVDSSGNPYTIGLNGGSGLVGSHIIKHATDGQSFQWVKSWYDISGSQPQNRRIRTDGTNVYYTGYSGNTSVSISGSIGALACSDGASQWNLLFRYGTGTTTGAVPPVGSAIWSKAMTIGPTGAIYVAGTCYDVSPRGIFVLKLPPDGIPAGTYGEWTFVDANHYSTTAPQRRSPAFSTTDGLSEGMTSANGNTVNNSFGVNYVDTEVFDI